MVSHVVACVLFFLFNTLKPQHIRRLFLLETIFVPLELCWVI